MKLPYKVIEIKNLNMLENTMKIHTKGAPRIYTTMKVNTRTDKEQQFADKVKGYWAINGKRTQLR